MEGPPGLAGPGRRGKGALFPVRQRSRRRAAVPVRGAVGRALETSRDHPGPRRGDLQRALLLRDGIHRRVHGRRLGAPQGHAHGEGCSSRRRLCGRRAGVRLGDGGHHPLRHQAGQRDGGFGRRREGGGPRPRAHDQRHDRYRVAAHHGHPRLRVTRAGVGESKVGLPCGHLFAGRHVVSPRDGHDAVPWRVGRRRDGPADQRKLHQPVRRGVGAVPPGLPADRDDARQGPGAQAGGLEGRAEGNCPGTEGDRSARRVARGRAEHRGPAPGTDRAADPPGGGHCDGPPPQGFQDRCHHCRDGDLCRRPSCRVPRLQSAREEGARARVRATCRSRAGARGTRACAVCGRAGEGRVRDGDVVGKREPRQARQDHRTADVGGEAGGGNAVRTPGKGGTPASVGRAERGDTRGHGITTEAGGDTRRCGEKPGCGGPAGGLPRRIRGGDPRRACSFGCRLSSSSPTRGASGERGTAAARFAVEHADGRRGGRSLEAGDRGREGARV